ncbi:MAG: Brp/Blh family beta-carotene 15,15'-dioxygenase [Planctomycetota bacterium]
MCLAQGSGVRVWGFALACAVALGVGIALNPLGVTSTTGWGPWTAWPWLLALLVFGMPHGAADWKVHRADRRRRGQDAGLRSFVPYLLWMLCASIALYFLPLVTIAAFFVLTAVHFGMADATHALGPKPNRCRVQPTDNTAPAWVWWAVAWTRGGLVLALPFAADPAGAWWPFALLSGTDVDALPISIDALRAACIFGVAALLWIGVVAITSIPRSAWRQPRRWFVFETLVAMALLAFTPPLFAVGVYFLCVHAPKHTVRLAGLIGWLHNPNHAEPTKPFPKVRLTDFLSVHLASIALWPLSLLVIAAWAWCMPDGLTVGTIAAASIGFYIVTTLPHHRLGTRLPV